MKLSILDPVQIPAGGTSATALQGSVALAQLAEELGYHRYWVVEHHGVPFEANPAPEVFAVALAAATRRIRIGVGGVLLNHYSPYKTAETLRTLHGLFAGRIDAGLGRATAGPIPDRALRRHREIEPGDDQAAQLAELVGWLGNDLPEDSPFHSLKIMPDLGPGPMPWVLAATEASARRAGEMGLAMACSAFHQPDRAVPAIRAYRAAFRPSPWSAGVQEPTVFLAVRLILGHTQAEAEALALPMRAAFTLRRQSGIHLERLPTPKDAAALPHAWLPPGSADPDWPAYVIGGPEQVRATFGRMVEQTGVDEIMVQDFLITQADREQQYRLLARTFDL